MKALTIRQPWASLIALGVKTIETRSWQTRYRGPIAIHAAARRPEHGHRGDWLIDSNRHDGPWMRRSTLDASVRLPLGAIVATANLVDVVPMVAEGELVEHSTSWKDQRPIIAVSRTGEYVTGLTWCNTVSPGRYVDKDWTEQVIAPNRPYGDFAPGRYAWILEDVVPCDPIPAKGKQGLWTWDGGAA